MRLITEFIVPIRTISEMNVKEHWAKIYKRKRAQKIEIFVEMQKLQDIPLPCHIIMTRYGKKIMDYDNLVTSFKFIQDEIANALIPGLAAGRADGDPRLSWDYSQEIAKSYAVKVSFFENYHNSLPPYQQIFLESYSQSQSSLPIHQVI